MFISKISVSNIINKLSKFDEKFQFQNKIINKNSNVN